jgi:hypothetical protein
MNILPEEIVIVMKISFEPQKLERSGQVERCCL